MLHFYITFMRILAAEILIYVKNLILERLQGTENLLKILKLKVWLIDELIIQY